MPQRHAPLQPSPRSQRSPTISGTSCSVPSPRTPTCCCSSASPPFHVVGFAPAGIPAAEGGTGGDIRWDSGSELRWKRPKDEDFLENNNINANLQISYVDFLQTRSVSTGLGLSLDDRRIISSGESPAFPLVDDAIERELQRQDTEMDRFIKAKGLIPVDHRIQMCNLACRSSSFIMVDPWEEVFSSWNYFYQKNIQWPPLRLAFSRKYIIQILTSLEGYVLIFSKTNGAQLFRFR